MKKIITCIAIITFSFFAFSSSAAKITLSTPDSSIMEKPTVTSIKDALKEFNSMSHHDKKMQFKEMKKELKQYKADKKAGKDVDSDVVLQAILAIFIPPLAVYLHEGETNNKFWISVLLTVLGLLIFGFAGVLFLGTLPSIIYALIVILSK